MKTGIKKAFSLIFSVILTVALLSSCTDSGKLSDSAEFFIGICQFTQHTALDSANDGFEAAVTEKLGDRVKLLYQNAAGERMNAASICSGFASENVDLIFANSTNALAAAAEATSTIPVVGCSVTDYESTLGIKLESNRTGTNVTGCSDLLPLQKQAEIINELFPEKGKVGILYCSSETNSKYQADLIITHLEDFGFSCSIYTFVDTTDVTLITQKAASEVDIIYTPTDNTVAGNTSAINNILEPAGVPLVAGNIDVAKECGVATVGIDYYKLGYEAGLMACEILLEGKSPADMEIRTATEYQKIYVPSRAAAAGLTVPSDFTAIE